MSIDKKLARVEHIRCGEYTAATFVWVRATMTEEEFEERVEAAEKAYLAALAEFAAAEKPAEYTNAGAPIWEKERDRTVGEVLDEHAAQKAARAEYDKQRRDALRPFDDFLVCQEGIASFWDVELELDAEVDWGHMHGTKIEYGETQWPTFRLLKTAQRRRPGRPVVSISETEEWV